MMPDPYDRPEYLAFVAAIKAAPDDDLPRLIAADWLEEQGEVERAEFIRAQCELASLEAAGVGPVRTLVAATLRREESGRVEVAAIGEPPPIKSGDVVEVIDGGRGASLAFRGDAVVERAEMHVPLGSRVHTARFHLIPLTPCPRRDRWRALKATELDLWGLVNFWEWEGRNEGYTVRRGFLESLRMDGDSWLTHSPAILRANPVRSVCIVGDLPYETDVPINSGRWPKYRLWRRGWFVLAVPAGFPSGRESWMREICRHEWPGVAFTFELGPTSVGRWLESGYGRFADEMTRLLSEQILRSYATDGGPVMADPRAFIPGVPRG